MRKGYKEEYKVKTKIERIYGKGNVIKNTSSQNIPDFVVLKKVKTLHKKPFAMSWFVFGVEVKSTIEKKYLR